MRICFALYNVSYAHDDNLRITLPTIYVFDVPIDMQLRPASASVLQNIHGLHSPPVGLWTGTVLPYGQEAVRVTAWWGRRTKGFQWVLGCL